MSKIILPPWYEFEQFDLKKKEFTDRLKKKFFKRCVEMIDMQYFVGLFERIKELDSLENFDSKYFGAIFYQKWIEQMRINCLETANKIEKEIKESHPNALETRDFIYGLGAKFHLLHYSKFCVATEVPAKCKDCFFDKCCNLPSKNKEK